jgi:CDP-diacylglycerol--glycerol-3-phosphate 3-phosphatidyltransferase
MNLPNLLTLSRVFILFFIAGLIYVPLRGAATVAFLLFIFAGVTDWLDGYFARKLNLVTDFGKLMDALTDKILVVGMFITLLATHLIPAWAIVPVLLIVSREFLITGLRLVAASNGTVLAAEKSGKQKTVSQIVSISVLLAVPALRYDVSLWTGLPLGTFADWIHHIGMAIFLFATIMTVYSGGRYLAKYWPLVVDLHE